MPSELEHEIRQQLGALMDGMQTVKQGQTDIFRILNSSPNGVVPRLAVIEEQVGRHEEQLNGKSKEEHEEGRAKRSNWALIMSAIVGAIVTVLLELALHH